MDLPWNWQGTAAELAGTYPCDEYAVPGARPCLRAIDIAAAPPVVFAWVCQLKAAPYSYDLLDNFGRRSPRTLDPGLQRLEVGQPFMVFRLVDFEVDQHVTAVTVPSAERLFGPIAVTYAVRPAAGGTRLVAKMMVGRSGWVGDLRRTALAWGDLPMMRKQLRTLKELAELVPAGQSNPDR